MFTPPFLCVPIPALLHYESTCVRDEFWNVTYKWDPVAKPHNRNRGSCLAKLQPQTRLGKNPKNDSPDSAQKSSLQMEPFDVANIS